MRKARSLSSFVATLAFAGVAYAQQAAKPAAPAVAPPPADPGVHVMKAPAELEWVDGPPSLPKGAKVAVLEGDPGKAGPFTIRIQFPAKYKIAPHWHPGIEHVTVISGEFMMGSGEKWDDAALKKMPAGAFGVMPMKYPHFAMAKKKAVVQLHGIGPWGITYINPADDPRNAGAAPAPAAPAPAAPPANKK
jgi:hypothetical protein